MRIVRHLKPLEENNFNITKSDNLSKTLLDNLKYVTIAALVIGIITMLGAAIALMNIMLVSVTERTSEIGIRKAIGARSDVIRSQFLTEAVLICLMGGVAGMVLGIIMGNVVAGFIGGTFIIPWGWMECPMISKLSQSLYGCKIQLMLQLTKLPESIYTSDCGRGQLKINCQP